jgi:hypothetical protein
VNCFAGAKSQRLITQDEEGNCLLFKQKKKTKQTFEGQNLGDCLSPVQGAIPF